METSSSRPVTIVEITEALQRRGEAITTHIVVLQDDMLRRFRVPIGPCEAWGIRIVLQNDLLPRPMTHDLIQTVLLRLGGEMDSVLLDKSQGVWGAQVKLVSSSGFHALEASPGDAIALALRANAPLLATEEAIAAGEEE
jgi:bifunctional DNase/RNase